MSDILLSIVLSTWNNCDELERTLASICECTVPPDLNWEVIVVNNNSSDNTDSVTESFCGRLPVVAVKEPQQGLSYGKNAGLREARGAWVLFTDDDVRPDKDWILTYLSAIHANPEGTFLGGPVISLFTGATPESELLSIATKAVRGFSLEHDSPTVTEHNFLSANWAAPTGSLREVGGFDVEMGLNPSRKHMRFGEESELQVRLREAGLRAIYLPQARLGHVVPPSKSTPEYILGRAEASSMDASRHRELNPILCIRLLGSMMFHFALWIKERLSGEKGYAREYHWRARRGKLRQQMEAARSLFPGEKVK